MRGRVTVLRSRYGLRVLGLGLLRALRLSAPCQLPGGLIARLNLLRALALHGRDLRVDLHREPLRNNHISSAVRSSLRRSRSSCVRLVRSACFSNTLTATRLTSSCAITCPYSLCADATACRRSPAISC